MSRTYNVVLFIYSIFVLVFSPQIVSIEVNLNKIQECVLIVLLRSALLMIEGFCEINF